MAEPTITLAKFFERAGAGELVAIECAACRTLAVPPRQLCPACGERQWKEVPLSGEGAIASYTVIRIGPRAHSADAPYAIAAVALREGVSLLGRVVDIPFDRLAIGLPVRFRPVTTASGGAIGFGPA